jgi:hypothetical protein
VVASLIKASLPEYFLFGLNPKDVWIDCRDVKDGERKSICKCECKCKCRRDGKDLTGGDWVWKEREKIADFLTVRMEYSGILVRGRSSVYDKK